MKRSVDEKDNNKKLSLAHWRKEYLRLGPAPRKDAIAYTLLAPSLIKLSRDDFSAVVEAMSVILFESAEFADGYLVRFIREMRELVDILELSRYMGGSSMKALYRDAAKDDIDALIKTGTFSLSDVKAALNAHKPNMDGTVSIDEAHPIQVALETYVDERREYYGTMFDKIEGILTGCSWNVYDMLDELIDCFESYYEACLEHMFDIMTADYFRDFTDYMEGFVEPRNIAFNECLDRGHRFDVV